MTYGNFNPVFVKTAFHSKVKNVESSYTLTAMPA
jgi:hypothetical protein